MLSTYVAIIITFHNGVMKRQFVPAHSIDEGKKAIGNNYGYIRFRSGKFTIWSSLYEGGGISNRAKKLAERKQWCFRRNGKPYNSFIESERGTA